MNKLLSYAEKRIRNIESTMTKNDNNFIDIFLIWDDDEVELFSTIKGLCPKIMKKLQCKK